MGTSRHTTTVEFDDELWELVEAEAARAGVSVSHFVRDAVIARIVVGPTDPRVFEVFANAVRQTMRDEPHPATRRQAERSLGALARLSASRQRSEARAVRAQSDQVIRRRPRHHDVDAAPADAPDPPARARSVFRVSADWSDIREVDNREASSDDGAPELACLQQEHIHPHDRLRVRAAVVRAIETRGILELQYRVRQDGAVRLIYLRALPLLTATGTISEWVAVACDITDADD